MNPELRCAFLVAIALQTAPIIASDVRPFLSGDCVVEQPLSVITRGSEEAEKPTYVEINSTFVQNLGRSENSKR